MKGTKRARPERGENVWDLAVEAGRDPLTGRRRRAVRAFHGSAREADTALAQLVADVSREQLHLGPDATLSSLLERWLEMVAEDLSPTTLYGYRRVVATQIGPALGDRPVRKITTPELDAFYRALLATRAPATVRQTHAILRRAFRQGVRWGWVTYNPAVDATPPRARKPDLHLPSPAQVTELVAAAGPDFGTLLRTAATTGARRGELCGLRWSRVDLEASAMLIERAVVEVGGKLVEKDTKTHQARAVALDPATVTALRGLRDRARRACLAFGAPRADDPFVFAADPTGTTPIPPAVVSKQFHDLARVHAPGTRLHDLRHFAATQLLAARVPVKTVSGRLGHQSAAMTLDVYGHVIPAADEAAATVLGDLIG